MDQCELNNYCLTRIGIDYSIQTIKGYLPPDYYITIPCGTCFACLKRKRLSWSFRLIQEMLCHKENTFITLTFTDEYLEKFSDDYKLPIKLFIDRLRKKIGYRPRYWFISEKGDVVEHTGRLHFHGIIFNTSVKTLPFSLLNQTWFYGRSDTGYVNSKTCNYLTKYLLKFQDDFKPIIMCSNGIGLSYLDSHPAEWFINNFDFRDFVVYNNRRYPLSNYYKSKVFDEDLKLVKMLNQYTSLMPFEGYINGTKFTDKLKYNNTLKSFYNETLRLGLSKPKKINNYAKLCISENRTAESR